MIIAAFYIVGVVTSLQIQGWSSPSVVMFCLVFDGKFRLPIGRHSSCSISPLHWLGEHVKNAYQNLPTEGMTQTVDLSSRKITHRVRGRPCLYLSFMSERSCTRMTLSRWLTGSKMSLMPSLVRLMTRSTESGSLSLHREKQNQGIAAKKRNTG